MRRAPARGGFEGQSPHRRRHSPRSDPCPRPRLARGNPGHRTRVIRSPSAVAPVAVYRLGSSGARRVPGYGTQAGPGVWALTATVNLAPGSYTPSAQAEASGGAIGDPRALTPPGPSRAGDGLAPWRPMRQPPGVRHAV